MVTTHTNPEGDAIGSELAFYSLLRSLGKEAVVINKDPLPSEFDFFPDKKKILLLNERTPRRLSYDCMVFLDCADLSRAGGVDALRAAGKPVLNIDHHISNQRFAEVNWVDPEASSCAEMVFRLYKAMHVPFDKASALYLYVGMMTDTGSFRYSNTHSSTHKAIAELLAFGIKPAGVYEKISECIPWPDIQLLSRIIPTIHVEERGRIAWVQVGKEVLQDKRPTFDLSEHLLGFMRLIKDVEVVVLFRQSRVAPHQIRVNFRSKSSFDVNAIASFFGGGGHKAASGAIVRGDLVQVRKRVLARIRQALR